MLGSAKAWSRVVVDGAGRLARDLTDDLRVAGVGQVTGGVFALDAELHVNATTPDLVVLVAPVPTSPATAAPLQARGIPHLPVAASELEIVVGPLVLPGRSACLGCLALTRDRTRPTPEPTGPPDGPVTRPASAVTDPTLHALARATAAMTVCAALVDQCPPGVSLELSMPWPRPVQRLWRPHPRCRCGAPDPVDAVVGREWTA